VAWSENKNSCGNYDGQLSGKTIAEL